MAEESQSTNEISQPRKPEFDGGSFTIEYLSRSAKGFEIKTNSSERRRKPIGPLQEDQQPLREPLPFDEAQTELLRKAMPGQIRYAKGNDAQQALTELRAAQSSQTSEETAGENYANYEEKRSLYQERVTPSVGITKVWQEGNTLVVDIKPADYPVFQTFARPSYPPEVLKYSSIMTGSAIVIVTKDQRLILQLRSDKNALWGGILGVSAAGYLQGKMYHPVSGEQPTQEIGTLVPINTEYVKKNILKETREEIGLDKEYLDTIHIVGFVKDKVKSYNSISLLGTTRLDAIQVRTEAQKASKNLRLSDVEFMEKFIDIPATPEAISTLVTQVKCPFPPDQYAAVILAGYNMVVEQGGREAADNWIRDLEPKVNKNYQEIDQMVAKYYQDRPEELNNIPQGKPPRNPHGYEPAYLLHEQGLPDAMSELKRVGLISSEVV